MTRPRDIADSINRINSSAADATAVTIDSSENVGVGITSSLEKFTVANTSSGIVGRFTNNVNQTLDLGITSGSGSAGGAYLNNANSGYVAFQSGGSERLRMLAGGGLTFNGDTAAANALDDYEEGTWTGSVSVNGFTQSVSSVAGRYTKIGRFVECHYAVTLSSAGYASGYSLWTGLPVSVSGVSQVSGYYGTGSIGANVIGNTHFAETGTSQVYLYQSTSTGTSSVWYGSFRYIST